MWAAAWPNIPESGPDSIFGLTVDKVAHGTPNEKSHAYTPVRRCHAWQRQRHNVCQPHLSVCRRTKTSNLPALGLVTA